MTRRDGARRRGPAELEGVVPLPVGVPTPTPSMPSSSRPAPTTIAEALVQRVDIVRHAYRSGGVVSTLAELILADAMLMTVDGVLWTVGATSGVWYRYSDTGWATTRQPPTGPFARGDTARMLLSDPGAPTHRWARRGPLLPEPLTAVWAPPA